jgi:hypothetical protein
VQPAQVFALVALALFVGAGLAWFAFGRDGGGGGHTSDTVVPIDDASDGLFTPGISSSERKKQMGEMTDALCTAASPRGIVGVATYKPGPGVHPITVETYGGGSPLLPGDLPATWTLRSTQLEETELAVCITVTSTLTAQIGYCPDVGRPLDAALWQVRVLNLATGEEITRDQIGSAPRCGLTYIGHTSGARDPAPIDPAGLLNLLRPIVEG